MDEIHLNFEKLPINLSLILFTVFKTMIIQDDINLISYTPIAH